MPMLRRPPRGTVWVHIDRLDRDDGKVWAVQFWDKGKHRYEVTAGVVILGGAYTAFFGAKGRQPKAVIVVDKAIVRECGAVLTVFGVL